MGRRREHDETTAAALLDAAERAIAEDGVDGLSLREVARDADTTTRAIYTLFGSKDGLLGALGVRALQPPAARGRGAAENRSVRRTTSSRRRSSSAASHSSTLRSSRSRSTAATRRISPRFRAARMNALALLHERFEPLAGADLLGGRTVPEAAMQFKPCAKASLGPSCAATHSRPTPSASGATPSTPSSPASPLPLPAARSARAVRASGRIRRVDGVVTELATSATSLRRVSLNQAVLADDAGRSQASLRL